MAMSELDCRKALVGTGLAITLLLSANGLRKHSFGLAGILFLVLKFFSVYSCCLWLRVITIESSIISGCG